MGVDYPGTVKDGKVTDAGEYEERRELVTQAIALLGEMPPNPAQASLQEKARRLLALVEAKAPGAEVSATADALRWDTIRAYGIAVAPKRAPAVAQAAKLYETQCAACHGATGRGDGPAAKGCPTMNAGRWRCWRPACASAPEQLQAGERAWRKCSSRAAFGGL